MSAVHPLLAMLLRAAAGEFPPVDGRVSFTGPLAGGKAAVVSFTGHAVLASGMDPGQFEDLGLDGFGRAMHPAVLLRLAGGGGHVEDVDVTLAARGRGGGTLSARSDLDEHPRVRLARSLRAFLREGFVPLGSEVLIVPAKSSTRFA